MGGLLSTCKCSNQSVTSFQDLSNELIYECFDYLSCYKIQDAFSSLNQRFKMLCEDYTYTVYLHGLWHVPNVTAIHSFRSLWIGASYQAAWINFSQIRYIRALALENLSASFCLRILEEIPTDRLASIHIGHTRPFNSSEQDRQASRALQTKIFQLASIGLICCSIFAELAVDLEQIPIELATLKILKIRTDENSALLKQLIERMPNLKRYQINERWYNLHSSLVL